jgi:signal transduction histidine kinase
MSTSRLTRARVPDPPRTRRSAPPAHVGPSLERLPLVATCFPELLRELEATLEPVVGPIRAGLMLWDEELDVLQMVPGSYGATDVDVASFQIRCRDPKSNAAAVFRTGITCVANRARGDASVLQDYVEIYGIDRFISVRLATPEQPVGVLCLTNKPSDFSVADQRRLELVAGQIATAVRTASTLFLLRRQQRLESILATVAVGIASGRSVQDFLSPALDDLGTALGAALVALVPTNSSSIVWRSQQVEPAWEQELILRARRQPGERADLIPPRKAGDPGSAAFHVPVKLGSRRIGTLSALRTRAEPFADDERSALARLADLAALAWATDGYQRQRVELARLDERQRIADDLHDDVAQILFGAQMSLDSVLEVGGLDAAAAAKVVRARALLVRGDEALRTVIRQVAPVRSSDLARELAAIASEVEEEFGLSIHVELAERAAVAAGTLRRPVRDALVKVARESLINAVKHAGPCRVMLRLQLGRGHRLLLTIVDDGIGASHTRDHGGHGLRSLRRVVRSQGGSLRVHSSPGGGTKIVASVLL